MSQSRLPEDLSAWPKDFYQLLGVPRRVNRRQLKQAYTALLRQFKPEHFPDHFRRIRDAYETVLIHVQWQEIHERDSAESRDGGSPEVVRPTKSETIGDSGARTSESVEFNNDDRSPARPTRPAAASLHDQLESLWNEAIAGDHDAYHRLSALGRQNPGRREVYVRLFWLLVVWPHLEPERDPRDWLVRGLSVGLLTGPAAELYRREIEDHPMEAYSPRCLELLNSQAELGHLADLLEWRWQAAGRLDRVEAIPDELARLRSRFVPAAEELWARLLLAALDQLVWTVSPTQQKLADAVWQELEGMEHLQLGLRHAFDRVDFLRSIAAGWRMLRGNALIPAELVELIRLSWLRPPQEIEPEVLRALGQLVEDPRRGLAVFDQIHKRSTAALAQIGQIVENCTEPRAAGVERLDTEHIQSLARLHIESRYTSRYEALRWHLLEFCLRERVSPEWLVAQPGEPLIYPMSAYQHLVQQIESDSPLRLIFAAARALDR